MRIIEGQLADLLAHGAEDPHRDDYIHAVLTDTGALLDPDGPPAPGLSQCPGHRARRAGAIRRGQRRGPPPAPARYRRAVRQLLQGGRGRRTGRRQAPRAGPTAGRHGCRRGESA
ncbi:exonuclease SbcCD subunit D C-terminal domain-containing protein [Cupriavidus basilensis]